MKGKTILASVLMLLLLSVFAVAVPELEFVKINGDKHESGDQLVVKRGDTIDIRVKIQANNSEDNIKVEAYLDGYEFDRYESVEDEVDVFDMDAGDTEQVDLEIKIPQKADKDFYDLKVRVGTRRGASNEGQFRLNLKGERHEVLVKKILMPNVITAGRGIFANIKVENIGQKDEDDITIRFEIPELEIEEFTTIDELEADDTTTSEDIVAFIDECTKAGDYEVKISVEFNEYDSVTKTETLTVRESDTCSKFTDSTKTLVSVPSAQNVLAGDAVVFPINIENKGRNAKTYVITVSKGVEAFGSFRVDPGNVIIAQPNSPETVFVFVTMNEDVTAGAKDFIVTIESGDEKQDLGLTANVVGEPKKDTNLKGALLTGLAILIIILVIVALIFGFNKLKPKSDDESDEEIGQTYY